MSHRRPRMMVRAMMASIALAALLPTLLRALPPLPIDKRVPVKVDRIVVDVAPGLHMPTDIAMDSAGTIYIADGARDRIVTLGPDAKFKAATTQPAGQTLKRPVGLFVDASDRLWITDTDHAKLVVIDKAGKLVESIDLPPTAAGKATVATDVAVTPDGKRAYVVDNLNHRLLVRDNATKQWIDRGKYGQAAGNFSYPFMVAVGQEDDIVITEVMNARLQVLTAGDKWAGFIGTWGVELGQLFRPKGLTTDARGRVFVGDSTTGVIQVFDRRGRNIGALTDDAGMLIKFEHPMGMCFDKTGRLWVIELRASRLAIVTLSGQGGNQP